MSDLTADELAVLEMHAAASRVRHLTPGAASQVNYELQKKGLLAESGCCGGPELTQAGLDILWENWRGNGSQQR